MTHGHIPYNDMGTAWGRVWVEVGKGIKSRDNWNSIHKKKTIQSYMKIGLRLEMKLPFFYC